MIRIPNGRVAKILGMAATALASVTLAATPALAGPSNGKVGGGGTSPTGYDVSYPQCPATSLPSPISFGIVGVNDGIVYSPNPCVAAEYTWAAKAAAASSTSEPHVSFYANTADPGPSSTYWPSKMASPDDCATSFASNPNSPACNYDYGWYAAQNSYDNAANTAIGSAAASSTWWLDIESANSWNEGYTGNSDDIQGALDFFTQTVTAGVKVGIYTNSSSWSSITGGSTAFRKYPAWLPGARTLRQAESNCTAAAPTAGPVALTQYSSSGLDADYDCPGVAP